METLLIKLLIYHKHVSVCLSFPPVTVTFLEEKGCKVSEVLLSLNKKEILLPKDITLKLWNHDISNLG